MLDNKTIGCRLKIARESLNKTQAEFVEGLKVDQSALSKAERGIEGLGPEKIRTLVEANGINPDFITSGKGDILLNPKQPIIADASKQYFTADQLFAMYLKAMERQDKIMDAQTVLLESIRKEMAKENTLAGMKANLDRTMAASLTAVQNQDEGMAEIRNLFLQTRVQKKPPSGGSGKGQDRIDEGSENTGKTPA